MNPNCESHQIFFLLLSLQKGMEITGFTPDEISGIFELLSGILNLGNIQFKGYTLPNSTDASRLKRVDESEHNCFDCATFQLTMTIEYITYACDMLGCPIKLLEESLTQRTVEAGRETVKKPLSCGQVYKTHCTVYKYCTCVCGLL